MKKQSFPKSIDSNKRRFVTGLAMGGVLAGFGLNPNHYSPQQPQIGTPELRGNDFDLT